MFLCPEGEEQHNTTLQHPPHTPSSAATSLSKAICFIYNASVPDGESAISLPLFLLLLGTDGNKKPLPPSCSGRPHNKSISPQRLILAVTDIQCGCTFRYQSCYVAEKGESERSSSRNTAVKISFSFPSMFGQIQGQGTVP